MTLAEVARELDVSPDTLRRWAREGLVPLPQGRWTPAALAHARIVARLREGFMEDLFSSRAETHTLEEAEVDADAGLDLGRLRIGEGVLHAVDEALDDVDRLLLPCLPRTRA